MSVGAPRGNQNARKYGFYSRFLDKSQRSCLSQSDAIKGLDEEINELRLKIRKLLENYPENVRLLYLAAGALNHLLAIRSKLKVEK
jgi:uncharacterized protein YjcR